MEVTTEKVGPAEAQAFMEVNLGNRPLRQRRVDRYAREMTNGQWLDAGDPFRLDWNGHLRDGQHRLAAIIKSGCTFESVVIRHLDPATFKVMDSGMGRSVADVLATTAGTHKAAIIRLYLTWWAGGDPRNTRDLETISRVDIADFFEEYEDIVDAAWSQGSALYNGFAGGNRSAWGAFAIRAWDVNKAAADEFMEGVLGGADLHAGSPVLALRNWLANDRRLTNSGYHLALLVKAWNDWLTGKGRTLMVVRADEDFPVIRARRTPRALAAAAE